MVGQCSVFPSLIHRATGCVGIRNEGQTGYLNTILHFLYSIKSFHDLLREIQSVTYGDGRPNITTALSRLFTVMETSTDIVSAKELTIAFGWEANHLQQPNDPFEIFNVLMVYFHDLFKGTLLYPDYSHLFFSFGRTAEAELYRTVAVGRHANLEEALKDTTMEGDIKSSRYRSPSLEYISVGSILMFQLGRFRYDVDSQSMSKVSQSFPLYHFSPTSCCPSNSLHEDRTRSPAVNPYKQPLDC